MATENDENDYKTSASNKYTWIINGVILNSTQSDRYKLSDNSRILTINYMDTTNTEFTCQVTQCALRAETSYKYGKYLFLYT